MRWQACEAITMKSWLMWVRLCATLFLVSVAANNHAQLAATPGAQAFAGLTQVDMYRAYAALVAKLTPIFEATNPSRIVALSRVQFSQPTRQLLTKVFGNDHPLHMKATRKKGGDAELLFSMDPGREDLAAQWLEISALTGKVEFSDKLRGQNLRVDIPYIRLNDGLSGQGGFSDLRYTEHLHKGSLGLWLGSYRFMLGQFSYHESRSNLDVGVGSSVFKYGLAQRGDRVDVDFDGNIDSVRWSSDGVGRIHLAAYVSDLDGKALVAYMASQRQVQASDLAEGARAVVIHQTGMSMLHAMFLRGLAIDIQDLSVQFHGKTASLDGRISWPPGVDVLAPDQLAKQMELRLNVRLPMSMVDTFVRRIMDSEMRNAAQSDQVASAQLLDKQTKERTAAMLAAGLNAGMIRVENDTLISTIEFKSSQLFLNGHVLPLDNARR
jgi:hypothetical protein